MPDEHTLTLLQADQARTDFALIEDQLEFLAGQLARVPTRSDIAKAASRDHFLADDEGERTRRRASLTPMG